MSEPSLPITWQDDDGSVCVLRNIEPGDVGLSQRFMRSLSYGTRYFRYGRGDFEYSLDEIRRLCQPQPGVRENLVVVTARDGVQQMLGSARYVVQPDGENCEFSIVVRDGWHHRGIGRRLMRALVDRARSRGLKTIYGRVLGTNARMIAFMRGLGFDFAEGGDAGSIKVMVRRLQDDRPPG